MRRILFINSVNVGSTGTIVREISNIIEENGYEAYSAYASNRMNIKPQKKDIIICNLLEYKLNECLSFFYGL